VSSSTGDYRPPLAQKELPVFDWLFEGHLSVYILLAVAAGAAFYFQRRRRKRGLLILGCALLCLIPLYFLLDRLVETDREQITRKLNDMAAAVPRRDVETIFVNISDDFRSPLGKNKTELRSFTQAVLNAGRLQDVVIWDITVQSIERTTGRARVKFRFKPKGDEFPGVDFLCDAEFDLHPSLGWRLRSCRFFPPGGLGSEIETKF
jgi:hypothetical protein